MFEWSTILAEVLRGTGMAADIETDCLVWSTADEEFVKWLRAVVSAVDLSDCVLVATDAEVVSCWLSTDVLAVAF